MKDDFLNSDSDSNIALSVEIYLAITPYVNVSVKFKEIQDAMTIHTNLVLFALQWTGICGSIFMRNNSKVSKSIMEKYSLSSCPDTIIPYEEIESIWSNKQIVWKCHGN